jgi:poly(A) polymerase
MTDIVAQLTAKFADNGFSLWEVGGSVRDSILRRQSHDIDLTTDALPHQIEAMLDGMGSIYTIGKKFGTIALNYDRSTIEITTFRKEVYHNGTRRPTVTFGTTLQEDLSRRDFTVNAIARNALTEEVVDPFGGLKDIKNRIIRCVGKDDDRFNEDPLRMLRAVRLACELSFKLNVKVNHPEWLSRIPAERIQDEFSRMILTKNPARAVKRLISYGLMAYIIPEFLELNIEQGKHHIKPALEHSISVLKRGSNSASGTSDNQMDALIFRLACLLHDIGKPDTISGVGGEIHFYGHQDVGAEKAETILKALRYSNQVVNGVSSLVHYHMYPILLIKDRDWNQNPKKLIRRLIRKLGGLDVYMLMDLVEADISAARGPSHELVRSLRAVVKDCLSEGEPLKLDSPIDGNEIMELCHISPGPIVGRIKQHLADMVVNGSLSSDDKESAAIQALMFYRKLN